MGKDQILQSRDTSEGLFGSAERGEKKMLKFIGWGKKSTPEYITQHQAVQGQERSDCSPGMSSSSQWLRWEQSAEEKQKLLLQNNLKGPNPRNISGFPGSPTTYVSLDIMSGRTFAAHRACPPQLLTSFLCQIYQPHNAPALIFRPGSDLGSRGDSERVPCRRRAQS